MTDSSEDEANSLDDLMMLAKLQASVVGETDVDLRVGRFEPKLERPLGEGTFSRVYEATDPQLERSVALKVYKKSSLEGLERQQVLEEARALAQLEHQNVVAIHEVGEHQGQIFLAMELVRGQTLEELHTTRPAWHTLVELYVQAGRGLAAAHGKGLVHGDFKPANVIVDEHGRPRVLDFGLARPHGTNLEGGATLELRVRPGDGSGPSGRGEDDTTRSYLQGTPAYMGPELFQGRPPSAQSDQFAFCVSLFEGVYGICPFNRTSLAKLREALDDGEPRLPSAAARKGVPKSLLLVLRRGLAKDPSERFASMNELLVALEAPLKRSELPVRSLLGFGLTAAAIAGGLWLANELSLRQCQSEATDLSERWANAPGRDSASAVAPVVDLEIDQLVQDWGASCRSDDRTRAEECRETSAAEYQAFEALVGEVGLPPSGHVGLTERFGLCMEASTAPATCRRPAPDSEAVNVLRQAQARLDFGRPKEAAELAASAVKLARDEGTAVVEIDALIVQGQAQALAGQAPTVAKQPLEDAQALATACNIDLRVVDAALAQLELGLRSSTSRLDEVRLPLRVAEALLAKPQMSGLHLRRIRLNEKRSDVGYYMGGSCGEDVRADLDRALELRREVVDDRAKQGLPPAQAGVKVADAELNLTNFLFDCGQLDPTAAAERAEQTLAGLREHLPSADHPVAAPFEYSSGRILAAAERFEDAELHYGTALALYTRFGRADGTHAADVHHAWSSLLHMQGRIDEAYEHAEANAEIRKRTGGRPLPLAEALDALGTLSQNRPDGFNAALAWHQQSAETLVRVSTSRPLDARELDQLALSQAHTAIDHCALEQPEKSKAAFGRTREVGGHRLPAVADELAVIEATLTKFGCDPN